MFHKTSALPGAVNVEQIGTLTPDAARKLARALTMHAEQADILQTMTPREQNHASIGNRHSALELDTTG